MDKKKIWKLRSGKLVEEELYKIGKNFNMNSKYDMVNVKVSMLQNSILIDP